MKPYLSILWVASLPAALAQSPKPVGMRDAVTHDQIVEASREAKKSTPPPVFTPVTGADPSVDNRPKDLLSRSEIFSYRGLSSLVPKRAVLHIPKELAERMVMQEQSKFVSWRDFLYANRAWIRTVPVSRVQAEGKQPLDEETLKSFSKERRVVIATYQEGPISVMPPRVAPAATATTTVGSPASPTIQPASKP